MHRNIQLEVIKVNKPFFRFLEVFLCTTSSQDDGYHVESTLQGFVDCEKFGGM
jgi:hypothetical protein